MARIQITRKIEVRDPTAHPTWRVGMAVNSWKHITGTALPARPTGYSGGIIDAYNGLAVDQATNRLFLAGAGGHNDYYGNEGYLIDLGVNAPSWVMFGSPSSTGALQLNQSYNADGRPASSHTYYSQQYVADLNRVMRFGAGALAGGEANSDYEVVGMSVATGAWNTDIGLTFDDVFSPNHGGNAVICCQNPTNQDVYLMTRSGGAWIRYSPSGSNLTRTVLATVPSPSSVSAAASAVDTLRNRILCIKDGSAARLYDIATDSWTSITISGLPTLAGHALEYDSAADRFVLLPGGAYYGRVWSISASDPAGGASEITVTGDSVPVGGFAGSAVWNRFRYLPNLGGFAYYPTEVGGTGIYFLATE